MQKDGWAKYKNENAKYLDTKKNSMQGIKSAKSEIANLALLIPCMEFEIF